MQNGSDIAIFLAVDDLSVCLSFYLSVCLSLGSSFYLKSLSVWSILSILSYLIFCFLHTFIQNFSYDYPKNSRTGETQFLSAGRIASLDPVYAFPATSKKQIFSAMANTMLKPRC